MRVGLGGESVGEQHRRAKSARFPVDGGSCVFRVAPNLCGDKRNEKADDDSEWRKHSGRKAAERRSDPASAQRADTEENDSRHHVAKAKDNKRHPKDRKVV